MQIFGDCIDNRVILDWLELYPNSSNNLKELENPFIEEEIKKAVFSMKTDVLLARQFFGFIFSEILAGS